MFRKADYIYICANHRNSHHTISALCNMNINQLKDIAGRITDDDKVIIEMQRIARKSYDADLEYNAKYYKIPKTYSADLKLDLLLPKRRMYKCKLDDMQQEFVNMCISPENKQNIIVGLAGPGSGKTHTLVKLVKKLQKNNKNVLCLMFNVNAENGFIQRLSSEGVIINNRKNVSYAMGIFVMTFHKYAYNSRHIGNSTDLSYSIKLAAKIKPEIVESWDYLIIDESQDITYEQYDLIKTINTKCTIYMGDPRQKVYSGSIFDKIVNENKNNVYKFIYNYRSNPNIVAELNKFSEANFSELLNITQYIKHELIAGGEPSVEYLFGENNEEQIVADSILRYKPGSTFAISPVTINKFQMSDKVNKIRQLLHNKHRNICISESGSKICNNCDYIINSRSVKGLEREQIIVFGISYLDMYSNYAVASFDLKCLLYVAMSRAISKVVIVIDKKNYFKSQLLKCILPNWDMKNTATEVDPTLNKNGSHKMIVTDLAKLNFQHTSEIIARFQPLQIDREFITDCVGYYVEYCFADHYDIIKKNYEYVYIKNIFNNYKFRKDTYYDFCFDKNKPVILNKHISQYDASALKYVIFMYSGQVGMPWTLCDKLKDLQIQLPKEALEFIDNIKVGKITHGSVIKYIVPIDRRRKVKYENLDIVIGKTDLECDNCVFEIKHAIHNEEHIKQAAIYGKLTGKRAFIINTYEGFIMEVTDATSHFDKFIRSCICFRRAKMLRNANAKLQLDKRILIFLDIEHDIWPSSGIREIGAIAVDLDRECILEVFHGMYGCREYCTGDSRINLIKIGDCDTQLTICKDVPQYNDEFLEFASRYPDAKYVQHGGSDCKKLHLPKGLDLINIYKNYIRLQSNGNYDPDITCGLQEVTNNVSGYNNWEAHRAFEDALITMINYCVMALER